MRKTLLLASMLGLAAGAGCAKDEKATDESATAEESAEGESSDGPAKQGEGEAAEDEASDPAKVAEAIGVEPGAWEHGEDAAAAAVVTGREGTVEVRRTGTESFAALAEDDSELYAGDQVRTGTESQATVTFSDGSVVELAELSAVAVGDRDASADPASSAAVLYGVGRFTVSDRAPGEGPFLVYGSGGIVGTKGTVYLVGVAASGDMRVGVEEGEVEVAGAAELDAPVAIGKGKAIVIDREGALAKPEPLGKSDWGTWRDSVEADLEVKAAAEYHAKRLAELQAEIDASYQELEALTAAAAKAEAQAEVQAEGGDAEGYTATAPEIGGAVEGAFLTSVKLQHRTYAMLGHAYLTGELYVRHPEKVEVVYEPTRPRISGAVLYHKKYHAVVHHHVRPLRGTYYVHHPVGRERARVVDHRVPKFYARVKVKGPAVRKRVKVSAYRPPEVRRRARKKRFRVTGPAVGWHAKVKVKPAKARGRWYVRPESPRSKIVAGVKAKAEVRPWFKRATARPKAKAQVRFGGSVKVGGHGGHGVKVRDHRGGKAGVGAAGKVKVRDHRSGKAEVGKAAGKVGAKVGGKVGGKVKVRDHRGKKAGVGAAGKVKVRDHRSGKAGVGKAAGKVGGKVKVRDHRDKKRNKRKRPAVKGGAKVKVKGKLKVGD